MLPLKKGEKYLIETPRWYYCVEVLETSELWAKVKGSLIHYIGDFTKALSTGIFSKDSEISPIPTEFVLTDWCGMTIFPWPHKLPMKRTHQEQE